MPIVLAFVAGFLATLIFHQGALGVLHLAGVVPVAPYGMAPTEPLGVPQVISLAFWGGVWGVVLLWPLRRRTGAAYWLGWLVLGAIGPSAVALGVVFPLKGQSVALAIVPVALLLNGIWGLGTALLLRAGQRLAPAAG